MGPVFPESSNGETPTTLSGFQAGWYPDLPIPTCMGVEGRCGELGDRMLTVFLGILLTARDAGEVFPLLMGVGKPLASVAGSRSQVTS